MSITRPPVSSLDAPSGGDSHLPITNDYPLTPLGRALLVGWAAFLIGGFALALWLEPDPRGFGTHQRLGLPPCTFRLFLGVDCPSCGSTTSFSHYVRGEWLRAAECNLSAFVLALACSAMIPWSLYSSWTGRLWKVQRPELVLAWGLGALCAVSLGQWTLRLLWSWANGA
jgi:hypothetical protein